jgi:hypothetical protein
MNPFDEAIIDEAIARQRVVIQSKLLALRAQQVSEESSAASAGGRVVVHPPVSPAAGGAAVSISNRNPNADVKQAYPKGRW